MATEDVVVVEAPAPEPESYGPKAVLHKFGLWTRLFDIIFSIWLFSGSIFWLTCFSSALISIAYTAFQFEDSVLVWAPVFGLGLIFYVAIAILKSLFGTSFKLMRLLWFYTPRLNEGPIHFIFSRLEPLSTHIVQLKDALLNWTLRKARQLNPDVQKRETDLVIQHLFLLVFVVVFGVPLLVISSIYGYWVILSYVTMSFCISAFFVIFLVNFGSRLNRAFTVVQSFESQDDAFLRASFMSSLRFDTGKSLFDSIANQGLALGGWVVVGWFCFDTTRRLFLILGLSIFGVSLVVKLPPVVRFLDNIMQISYIDSKGKLYYSGVNPWPAFVFATLIHTGSSAVGVVAMLYFENQSFQLKALIGNSNIALVTVFLLSLGLRNAAMVLSLFPKQSKKWIILGCHISMIAFSVAARVVVGGFASTAMILLAYLTIDYRHPKFAWNRDKKDRSEKRETHKENYVSIINRLLESAILIIFVSLIIGIVKSSTPYPAPRMYSEDEVAMTFRKAQICTMRVGNLTIFDLATIAGASYADDPTLVPLQWTNMSRISNFVAGPPDQAGSKLSSFQEYNQLATNVTVISIRGTFSLSDAFQDIYLYSGSGLLKATAYCGTFVNLWPPDVVAYVVSILNSLGRFSDSLRYWSEVATRVQDLQARNRSVILTGHSLGGAIAGIVGAKYNVPAFGFSAPGIGYQTLSYGFSRDAVSRYFVNIIPENDVVPKMDYQVGLQQIIPCSGGEPIACHGLYRTQNTLQDLCLQTE
ncbi:hypothetical protein EDD86DRAFT_203493 [Gorgonomyces haynaldii]|nr:hypothetical protein EDD86DRAFT_203493 [Gorgonomyces haynaldii]